MVGELLTVATKFGSGLNSLTKILSRSRAVTVKPKRTKTG